MDSKCLINREPIFGPKLDVVCYEVRTSPIAAAASEPPAGDDVPFTMFTDSTLNDIVGHSDCLVRLTSASLADRVWESTPKARMIFAFLDEIPPSDPVVEQLVDLLDKGYRLTISDRLPAETLAKLAGRVHSIQVDALGYAPEDLEKRVHELRPYKAKLMASNVDTHDDLVFCKELQFDLYKGRFVARSASKTKEIPVNRLALMRVLAQLEQSDIEMAELEKVISLDVSLSFKLLSYANSAAVGLSRKVQSVGHAARMVGIETLRNWARVLVMSSVEDKPRELMTIALVRARMCERLSESIKAGQKESFFSAGLLSALDALLDCPIEKAIAELPLVDEVKVALTDKTGPIGQALRCTLAYERADWDDVQFYGLPPLPIRDIYVEAISWAQGLTGGLLSSGKK